MLTALSGLGASRAHPGVLYAHPDATTAATFYAMDLSGKDLGSYTLTGATANDWEDVALGNGPKAGSYVYLADIGDNSSKRTEIQVFRVPEPDVSPTQSASQHSLTDWEVLRFTYPDGAHDAETLMVDPVTGDILIVTKVSDGNSTVFRAPGDTPADTPTALAKLTTIKFAGSGQPAQASAGDISPTGDRFMIRTYSVVSIWPRGPSVADTFSQTPHTMTWSVERQGEGITFAADGNSWLAGGEQETAIYQATATCAP